MNDVLLIDIYDNLIKKLVNHILAYPYVKKDKDDKTGGEHKQVEEGLWNLTVPGENVVGAERKEEDQHVAHNLLYLVIFRIVNYVEGTRTGVYHDVDN